MLSKPRSSRTRVAAEGSDDEPQAVMSAAGLLGAALIVLLLAAVL